MKEMFDMVQAGIKMKNLRKSINKTAEAVADDLGISISSYNKYEQGIRTPRDEIKERIANYYNSSIASIFIQTNITNSDNDLN